MSARKTNGRLRGASRARKRTAARLPARVDSSRALVRVRPEGLAAIDAGSEMDAAFDARFDEMQALPTEALVPMNFDVRGAILTVVGCVPKIQALRERIGRLPEIDVAAIDSLHDYAMALALAQSRYNTTLSSQREPRELLAAAKPVLRRLRGDIRALVARDLIDRSRTRFLQGRPGYLNVGFELMTCANLLADEWPHIAGKTPLTVEEIRAAKVLGEDLYSSGAVRKHKPKEWKQAAGDRQRAATLMLRAYEEARRAVAFLRWAEGDAEQVAPSLHATKRTGKARRRREAGGMEGEVAGR